MNQCKRFLLQSFLWLIVWLILFAGQNFNSNYLLDHSVAYLFQVCLIAGLIFYGAKTLLFKKRYLLFTLISLASLIFCAQISSSLIQLPKKPKLRLEMRRQGPPPEMKQEARSRIPQWPQGNKFFMPKVGSSKFFIHFLMLSISFIIAAFIEVFIFAKKKEEEHLRVETAHLQTELKLLKTQINPHFLFNSLNNIYALSAIDTTRTQESISYLSNMLRYVLYECERPKVLVQKEIDYIENYIKLFSLKSSEKYPITTHYEIADPMAPVAPMIFIPFIENALKHSHIEKRGKAFINIELIANSKQIALKVTNSKPTQKIEKDDVGGIGLENVKKRLAIVYSDSYKLKINETSTEYFIDLMIKI
tara:strand:- start:11131 stop:12216 length:1086 start_codon:yes stop_codon:yes gene_type:complete